MTLAVSVLFFAASNGTYHIPLRLSLLPLRIVLLFFVTCSADSVKVAVQPSSHNCPMDNRLAVVSVGNMCACDAAADMPLIGKCVLCVDDM